MFSGVESLRAALQEVDDVVWALEAEQRMREAIELAVRSMEIRKQHFGVGSREFEECRVNVARMTLEVAEVNVTRGQYKEAAEFLAQVDALTSHSLDDYKALDVRRLFVRIAMLKLLMAVRQQQRRYRSALSFGHHLLDLAKRLCAVFEIPGAHMNLGSVYSAMNLHDDAISHNYMAYQTVNKLMVAVKNPSTYPIYAKSLEMEAALREKRDSDVYTLYEACLMLKRTNERAAKSTDASALDKTNDFDDSAQPDLSSIPLEHPVIDGRLSALEMLLSVEPGNDATQLVCSVMRDSTATSLPQNAQDFARWGGMLALAYRNIGVEQEHLRQHSSALLTYRVAHSTALQHLGASHPVTLQIVGTLKDADVYIRRREAQRTFLSSKSVVQQQAIEQMWRNTNTRNKYSSSKLHRAHQYAQDKRLPNSQPVRQIRTPSRAMYHKHFPEAEETLGSKSAATPEPMGTTSFGNNHASRASSPLDGSGAADVKLSRIPPIWNSWFNSKDPPPAHKQILHTLRYAKRKKMPTPLPMPFEASASRSTSPAHGESSQGYSLKTIHTMKRSQDSAVDFNSAFPVMYSPPSTAPANVADNTAAQPGIEVSVPPSSQGNRSTTKKKKLPPLGPSRFMPRDDFSYLDSLVPGEDSDSEVDEVDEADYSFLQHTFKLTRTNPSFGAPRSRPGTVADSSQSGLSASGKSGRSPNASKAGESPVTVARLARERRQVEKMAREMGL